MKLTQKENSGIFRADLLLEKFLGWFSGNKIPFFATVLIGILAHGFVMANKLLNHDELASLFSKGATVSSGRWGLALTSYLIPDYSMPWINGVLSILLIAVAVCLLVELFCIRSKALQVLLGGLVITFPSLTGIFSYMFTAPSYALAFLLAVTAVCLASRGNRWGNRIGAIACLVLSLGIYQAYIAVAASMFVLYMIWLLYTRRAEAKETIARGVGYVLVLLAGLVVYWMVNQLALMITGTQTNSYAVNARSDESILFRLVYAYYAFAKSLITGAGGMMPTVWNRCLHILSLVVILAELFFQRKADKFSFNNLLLAALVCLLPLAINSIYLLVSRDAVHTLMMYGQVAVYVFAAFVLDNAAPAEKQRKLRGVMALIVVICMVLLIISCVYFANSAYLNLHLQYENTYAMCNNILTQMQMTPGYTAQTPLLLAGFYPEAAYTEHFTQHFIVAGLRGISINSWSREFFFPYYCGVEIPMATEEQAAAVQSTAAYAQMPCYPNAGSVQMIDGIMVVKLSN